MVDHDKVEEFIQHLKLVLPGYLKRPLLADIYYHRQRYGHAHLQLEPRNLATIHQQEGEDRAPERKHTEVRDASLPLDFDAVVKAAILVLDVARAELRFIMFPEEIMNHKGHNDQNETKQA